MVRPGWIQVSKVAPRTVHPRPYLEVQGEEIRVSWLGVSDLGTRATFQFEVAGAQDGPNIRVEFAS